MIIFVLWVLGNRFGAKLTSFRMYLFILFTFQPSATIFQAFPQSDRSDLRLRFSGFGANDVWCIKVLNPSDCVGAILSLEGG